MTIKQYYRGFGSFGTVVTVGLTALPVASRLLPNSVTSYAFPPLGEINSPARFATIGFIFVTTYVIYLLKDSSGRSKRRLALTLWSFAFLGCALYFASVTRFVRIVSIPTLQDSITVSVGFERTPFAQALEPASDADLLRLRGPEEEEIQKLWTYRSLIMARLALWASYCLVLSTFVGIVSLGALEHAKKSV